jgi:hypothetical protein
MMEKVYYNTELEALNAELILTEKYSINWKDGITTRWCKPIQVTDDADNLIDEWYIFVNNFDLSLLQ